MSVAQSEKTFVRVDVRDGVATLTLDRPPLNVLTIAMMRELDAALERVGGELGLRAIVLRGQGRAFSAGVDVAEHQGETLGPLLEAFDRLILRVLESPIPTVAVVHGAALGGGCELAVACDLVLVAEDAKLGVPEIKLGVFPPAAAVLFPRLVGTHRAMELILTGEAVSGAEAARIGLANRAVPAAELDAALGELLGRLRALSGYALGLARRAVVESAGRGPREALERLERLQLDELVPAHDPQEGLQAFLEKRPAVWQHR